jgi:hypothetical protein
MNKSYKNKSVSRLKSIFKTAIPIACLFSSLSVKGQTTYSFTSCGATGQFGPTQGQINTAYAATNLSASVIGTAGIQTWTVPAGVTIVQIQAFGAQGGSSGVSAGGLGASIHGDFTVTPGQVLKILVGQQGIGGADGAAGGGGGSYVTDGSNIPLVVAGGGSGAGDTSYPGLGAGTASVGNAGQNCASTGTTGAGGGDANACGCGAGGAGGLNGNGSNGGCWGNQFGYGFVNGGNGGISGSGGRVGGFGGGAGTHQNNTGGGAGGGYTGGGAPYHGGSYVGGAGSSYNAGTNQVNTGSVQTGAGKVNIISLCAVGAAPSNSTLPANENICSANSTTLLASGNGTVNWYQTPTSTVVLGSGTTFITPTLSAGNHTFYAATTNTCAEGPRTPISITVNALPIISVIGSTETICPGTQVVLTANGADTYSWSSGENTSTVTPTPTANITYTVIGTSSVTGCSAEITSFVSVYPSPNIETAGSGTICVGESISLASNGGNTYTWQPGNLNGFQIAVSPTISTDYTVTGTDGNGCNNSAIANVVVTSCTGISEVNKFAAEIFIYPNPNNGEFSIRTDSEFAVSLLNNLGQIVDSFVLNKNNHFEISVKELPSGIYFVIGKNDDLLIKKKIIVTR